MHPEDAGLSTPWIRDHLVEWLTRLSDRAWQEDNWVRHEPGDSALDEMLDFFDDSGVLAEPLGRLGHVLVDEAEAAAMAELGAVLDRAISTPSAGDADIIRSPEWEDVVVAAREALASLGGAPGRPAPG